jgi:hypothetical protein
MIYNFILRGSITRTVLSKQPATNISLLLHLMHIGCVRRDLSKKWFEMKRLKKRHWMSPLYSSTLCNHLHWTNTVCDLKVPQLNVTIPWSWTKSSRYYGITDQLPNPTLWSFKLKGLKLRFSQGLNRLIN